MEERRRTPRIKEENEATITVLTNREKNLPKEKIMGNYTKDISALGAGIKTDILLPIDTLLELDFTSKGVQQQIKAFGKVKWVKVIIEDESYDAGLEFFSKPSDAIKKLGDYISWKIKSESELTKKEQPPIESGEINIVETKEQPPIKSIVETKEQPPIKSIVETKEQPPIKSIVKTKERSPIKNKQWIKIAIISLVTIILIVVLLKILGFIPEFDGALVDNTAIAVVYIIIYAIAIIVVVYGFFYLKNFALTLKDGFAWWDTLWTGVGLIGVGSIIMVILTFSRDFIHPHTNNKVTKNFTHNSITAKPATLPAPPIATPVQTATSTPAPVQKPTPASVPKAISTPAPKAIPAPETKATSTPTPTPKPIPTPLQTAISAPAPKPIPAPVQKQTPVSEAKQKIKVIGNRDSKRYHLPGMKYYNAVKAYHRVEFDSEADAIKAGYHKASVPTEPAPKVEVAPAPAQATPKATSPVTGPDSSTIKGQYPEGSQRILKASDFVNKSAYDLKILKNEIYARHGYIFKTNDLIKYFSKQPWYKPKYSDVTKYITEIEKDNINTIKNYQKSNQ